MPNLQQGRSILSLRFDEGSPYQSHIFAHEPGMTFQNQRLGTLGEFVAEPDHKYLFAGSFMELAQVILAFDRRDILGQLHVCSPMLAPDFGTLAKDYLTLIGVPAARGGLRACGHTLGRWARMVCSFNPDRPAILKTLPCWRYWSYLEHSCEDSSQFADYMAMIAVLVGDVRWWDDRTRKRSGDGRVRKQPARGLLRRLNYPRPGPITDFLNHLALGDPRRAKWIVSFLRYSWIQAELENLGSGGYMDVDRLFMDNMEKDVFLDFVGGKVP